MEFEEWKEVFEITEWRDGAIYQTRSLGCRWVPEAEIKANRPRETNLLYVVANEGDLESQFPDLHIRRVK